MEFFKLFPYENYRSSQLEHIRYNYVTMFNKSVSLINAPTGCGKTLNALVPAFSLIKQKKLDKVIFVTPRKSQHDIVMDDVGRINRHDFDFKVVDIVGKEELCLLTSKDYSLCGMGGCIYGKTDENVISAYGQRAQYYLFDTMTLQALFKKRCPQKSSLELAKYCDVIVCDYNYVFSPSIRDIFINKTKIDFSNCALVVDEAHNLYSRVLNFYSSEITLGQIDKMQKIFSQWAQIPELDFCDKIALSLRDMRELLISECASEFEILKAQKSTDTKIINTLGIRAEFQAIIERTLKDLGKLNRKIVAIAPEEADVYQNFFNKIKLLSVQLKNNSLCEDFIVSLGYYRRSDKKPNWFLKLKKIDIGQDIKSTLNLFKSSILMSATLNPLDYYANLFGFEKDDVRMKSFSSPFPIKNKMVVIDSSIDFTYRNRTASLYETVAERILTVLSAKKGNYMIFSPSYLVLEEIYDKIQENKYALLDYKILVENSELSNDDKKDILLEMESRAQQKKPTLLLTVMGGSFSEGVDLKGDSLIGIFILSLGLPAKSIETERLTQYYNNKFGNGFLYTVVYPGIARVVQSAGRLIRTEKDKGMIFLMDKRFTQERWNFAFPDDLKYGKVVRGNAAHIVKNFWEQN